MKKILIIEDDPILSSTLSANLEKSGFSIIKAEDGEQGLALALQQKPDLILLDILMPKMDGLTMLRKLRQDEWGKNVAVIILSNLSSPEGISNALETIEGLKEYLVKSDWKIEDVIKKVQDLIGDGK